MAKKEVNNKDVKKTNKTEKNKKTFFKSFKTELKKVVWLTPKQLVNNTVTVVSIVIICAVIVFALDMVFETVKKQGIERIRDAVVKVEDNTTENSSTENATDSENTTEVEVTNTETEEANTTEADNNTAENTAENTNATE